MAVNRRILFFNAKRKKCDSTSPHLGLAMLTAVLKKKGHEVLMVDYQFKHTAPSPESFIKDFDGTRQNTIYQIILSKTNI